MVRMTEVGEILEVLVLVLVLGRSVLVLVLGRSVLVLVLVLGNKILEILDEVYFIKKIPIFYSPRLY